jgi:hypothetical protein
LKSPARFIELCHSCGRIFPEFLLLAVRLTVGSAVFDWRDPRAERIVCSVGKLARRKAWLKIAFGMGRAYVVGRG